MGTRFYTIFLGVGLFMRLATVVAIFLLGWLGFLASMAHTSLEVIDASLALSVTLSPASIYLYFIQTNRIKKIRNKIALISFEIILFTVTLVVPAALVGGYPQFLSVFIFCIPPFLSLLIGLGLKRLESGTLTLGLNQQASTDSTTPGAPIAG
jgi:hypothetical protein